MVSPYHIPDHWSPDHQTLCSHFWRISRQPQAVQSLLISKLSCGLRLAPEQIQALYQEFCQSQSQSKET